MVNRLKEQLELRKEWLESPEKNYNKADFMEDWKEYQKTVEEAQHLELIGYADYIMCKEALMKYMHLF